MAHAVDKARMIVGLLAEGPAHIVSDLALVLPVLYVLLEVIQHMDDLKVCTAVTWSLEGTYSR